MNLVYFQGSHCQGTHNRFVVEDCNSLVFLLQGERIKQWKVMIGCRYCKVKSFTLISEIYKTFEIAGKNVLLHCFIGFKSPVIAKTRFIYFVPVDHCQVVDHVSAAYY